MAEAELDFKKSAEGLIPVIVQDWQTKEVLMLAYINDAAWKLSRETGIATYWTRSRQKLWVKGEVSGNVQKIKEIVVDCDQDTVLFKVEQVGGAACHLGYRSCFFRHVEKDGQLTVTQTRVFDPKEVYQK